MQRRSWILLILLTIPPGCKGSSNSSGLYGKEWTLVELNGQPVSLQKPPTLLFESPDHVGGFGGCNRLSGTFKVTKNQLTFSPLMMTKMACAEGMDVETAFATALGETKEYAIKDSELELIGDAGALARLKAQ